MPRRSTLGKLADDLGLLVQGHPGFTIDGSDEEVTLICNSHCGEELLTLRREGKEFIVEYLGSPQASSVAFDGEDSEESILGALGENLQYSREQLGINSTPKEVVGGCVEGLYRDLRPAMVTLVENMVYKTVN